MPPRRKTKEKIRHRRLRIRNGCMVKYIDSGWSEAEWAVIEAAMASYEEPGEEPFHPPARNSKPRRSMTETDYAPGWRPEEGDEIAGRVIEIGANETDYGVYPILTLEDEGGTQVAVHCIHSILRREIARRYEPTQILGEQIRIKYLGKQKTKDGKRDFHSYKVFGGNRQATYDWNQDLPPEERRSSAEPPIAPSNPSAPASGHAGSSADAGVEDFSPLPPSPPKPQGEQFGEAPPF